MEKFITIIFLKDKYKIKTTSTSDCEVILYMYEKFGFEETCRQLDGVFSLIIYNDNTKRLYVGRDPYGVRPLFIGYTELDELFFSSEMKAIDRFCIYVKQFKPGFYLEYNIFDKTTIYRNYHDFTLRIDKLRCNDFIFAGIRNKLTSAVKKD